MLRLLGLLREQLVYWGEGIDVKEGEQVSHGFSRIHTDFLELIRVYLC
jgi:hypothetical protein